VRRGTTPPGALLVVSESESLGRSSAARKTSTTSSPAGLKTLGAEKRGVPGTWPKGVEEVEDFLAQSGSGAAAT
jgi:D-alanyl-D-alanine carboxypeptidase/D-alanyl-D-alanine-endopeptidase (penicillin-binding protein 4)